jgi:hypothetical protein
MALMLSPLRETLLKKVCPDKPRIYCHRGKAAISRAAGTYILQTERKIIMPNFNTGRYTVTQKYLMTRGQALSFPAKFFNTNFKKDEVYGVVVDIPLAADVLTTMVCFINGAANLYFNNGGEYTGASQKYRNLVQAAHNLVANAGQLIPNAEKVNQFDLPIGRTNNVFLLTKNAVYKVAIPAGIIPEDEPEKRNVYVLYQRVLNELRSCQLKDDAERRKAASK